MSRNKGRIILIDADVISHFISGNAIYLLPTIFPFEIKILDKVYNELQKFRNKKIVVDNLINQKLFEILPFPEQNENIKKEYFWIKSMMFKGDGEAACLAVARFTGHLIGSSNLRDIKHYCKMHSISYLTTMDFLCCALETEKMGIQDCNLFISKVLQAGSKLPVTRMEDYFCDLSGL